MDSKTIAHVVHAQLAEDFPEKAIAWVLDKDLEWEGPVDVPLKELDFDNVHAWHAWHDEPKVQKFEKKIKKGKLKPAILVKRPHKPTKLIADGHHRALASRRTGNTLRAYVANAKTVTGGWDEMHDSQNRYQKAKPPAHAQLVDKSPSNDNTGAVIVIDDGAGHVLATTRNGKKDDLDLPGGRLEPGETPEQAARRETFEETGVTVGAVSLLYAGEGSGNRKHVSVFRAIDHNAKTLDKLEPEKGEEVRWVKPQDLASKDCTFGKFTKKHFDALFGHLGVRLTSDAAPIATLADVCVSAPWMQEHWRSLFAPIKAADTVHLPAFENTAPVGGPQAITTPPADWLEQAKRGLDDSTFTMPFQSQAQREWMHATHPEMAKRWEKHTPPGPLPRKVTADIGASGVHVDGLSGGYRLETAAERAPNGPGSTGGTAPSTIPDLRSDIHVGYEQPVPPRRTDITPVQRWPLTQSDPRQTNMISAAKRIRLPTDKFALPDQRKYPIDTAARTRNAAARLEQNKSRLSSGDYAKAKAAIGRAAKKFGIHSQYNETTQAADTTGTQPVVPPRATDHLVPHMHVEATIPHGGNLHVRHLSDGDLVIFGPPIQFSAEDV